MADDPLNPKERATLQLGMDTEQFLNTPMGKYLLDRAQADAIEAFQQLKELKRSDFETAERFEAAFVELQYAIKLPELFELWLQEAILSARNVEHELSERNFTE